MLNALSETKGKQAMPTMGGKASQEPKLTKIKSRFGEIEVDTNNAILFRHGLLGIPAAVTFCLTDLPGISRDQFMLLQCMEDHDLSFIVVPSQYDNQLIKTADLDDASKVLDIETQNLIVLFIVTVHEKGRQRNISVNAKAPVLIDALKKTATQFVLAKDEYKIQHMIS